jgi:hypothetical protein
MQCVQGFVSFRRPFLPPNYSTTQKNCDVALDYRKYEISAGWVVFGSSADPAKTSFGESATNKVFVDFN